MSKFLLLAVFICLLPYPAAKAEQRADTVVVTASRIAEKEKTIPQSVTIIDAEALDKCQYENLGRLLQNYGIGFSSYGPNQQASQVSIRGMDSSYSNPFDSNVLILVDGAPTASANPAMIPMAGIERIEILRGPAAVQYGSSAMGGVINIIPKKGGDEFNLSAEAGGGTWLSERALGSLAGKKYDFDFSGAASWNRQNANYATGSGKLYQDTELDGSEKYILNLGYNFNEENRLGLLILGVNDWGSGLNQPLQTEQRYNGLDYKMNQINSTLNVSYAGGYEPSGLKWLMRYFNAYNQMEYLYPLKNPQGYRDSTIEASQKGGQGQISWQHDFLTLTAGADYTLNEYLAGTAPAYQQQVAAGFGQIKLAFWDELLILTGGARYDSYTYKVNGNQENMENLSLSAGIALNPLRWLTLKANIAQSYKAPSGLYAVGYDGPNGVEGNPDLKPEQGLGWDCGLDIRWRGLNLAVSYFSTDYRDKFVYDTLANGRSYYYNADGSIWYNGLEGQAGFDLGEFFEWDFILRPYLNFTRLFNYNDSSGSRLYNVRDLVAAFGVNFSYPEWGADLDVRCNYSGYQKEQIWNGYNRMPDRRTGGITTVDLFLSQKIYEFKDGGRISLKGEIRNLGNENYAFRHDYPMPGRSFYLGVRYDF